MRNNILLSALTVTSQENLEPEAAETAELNPVTDLTVVEIDEILEEVRDGADSVEEHDDAVEELEGAAESLESLIASLESAIADGGMNPQAADIHSRAMINAVRRLPVDGAQYTVSVESFGGTGDKLQASMEAMEGAKDLLAKIWNAIKSAVQSAWAAVIKFVQTIGQSGEVLIRAGTQLKGSASKLSGNPKTETMAIGNAGKFLHTGGKMEGLVSQKLHVILAGGEAVSKSAAAASAGLKSMTGKMMTGTMDDESFEAFAKSVMDPLPKDTLPGGREFEAAGDLSKLVEKTKFEDATQEVATPQKAELIAIANEIVAVGRMVSAYDKKYFKELQKSVNDFISKQEDLLKKANYEKDETAGIKGVMAGFKRSAAIARAAGPSYMSYAANAAKASFGFAKKALAAY